jgi:hypothetical protein
MKKHDFWTRTNNNNKGEKNTMIVGDLSQLQTRASIMLTKIGATSITKKKNNVVSGILSSCE